MLVWTPSVLSFMWWCWWLALVIMIFHSIFPIEIIGDLFRFWPSYSQSVHGSNVVMRPIIRFVRVCSRRISGSFGSIPLLHIIPNLHTALAPIEEAQAQFQCRRAQITQINRDIIASCTNKEKRLECWQRLWTFDMFVAYTSSNVPSDKQSANGTACSEKVWVFYSDFFSWYNLTTKQSATS